MRQGLRLCTDYRTICIHSPRCFWKQVKCDILSSFGFYFCHWIYHSKLTIFFIYFSHSISLMNFKNKFYLCWVLMEKCAYKYNNESLVCGCVCVCAFVCLCILFRNRYISLKLFTVLFSFCFCCCFFYPTLNSNPEDTLSCRLKCQLIDKGMERINYLTSTTFSL